MIPKIRKDYSLSLTRTLGLVSISKTAYYHRPKKSKCDQAIAMYLEALSDSHKRWGFDKMMLKAKLENKPWNHKRVYRIYRELGLNLKIKPRKRLPKGEAKVLIQPIESNLCWSIDFMSDVLWQGQKFRTFNVIDDFNREGLRIEPSYTLPAIKVTQLLDEIISVRGLPEMIRVDNGPEFVSHVFKKWAKSRSIFIHYIQPGKPAQNGFVERFNRTYREDVLDMNCFNSLKEVKAVTREWLAIYNEERPHESLSGLPPVMFRKRYSKKNTGKQENLYF